MEIEVRTGYAGTVSAVHVAPGASVSAGAALATVLPPDVLARDAHEAHGGEGTVVALADDPTTIDVLEHERLHLRLRDHSARQVVTPRGVPSG